MDESYSVGQRYYPFILCVDNEISNIIWVAIRDPDPSPQLLTEIGQCIFGKKSYSFAVGTSSLRYRFCNLDCWVEEGPSRCEPSTCTAFKDAGIPFAIRNGGIKCYPIFKFPVIDVKKRTQILKKGQKINETCAKLLYMLNIPAIEHRCTPLYLYVIEIPILFL